MATAFEKLKVLSGKKYAEQAKFFLNAFWTENFADNLDAREQVWKETQGIIKIDPKGKKGHELSEIKAHLFIEKFGGAATWVKFRDVMRKIDKDFNKKMSLTEFFIFHYKLDWKVLVKREQVYGKEAQAALDKANAALEQANEAMLASQKAADESKAAQVAAEEALAAQKAAEEEVRAGLALIEKEEAKKAAKILKYKTIYEDPSTSTVKKGKAFQQMKKAEGEDPLPLRKAKLEQQAKVRKAKKASRIAGKRAKKATAAAEKAAAAAKEAETAFEQASDTVQKLASSLGGAGEGTLYWMDRELEEAAQFLPKSKQRALRKKMAAAKKALLGGAAAPTKKKKKKKKKGEVGRAALGVAIFGAKLKRKVKKKKKSSATTRAKVTLEIAKKDQNLKHVDAPDDGPSEAVKAAFIEDQKAAAGPSAATSAAADCAESSEGSDDE